MTAGNDKPLNLRSSALPPAEAERTDSARPSPIRQRRKSESPTVGAGRTHVQANAWEQLRDSRERLALHRLERKISLAPRVDPHPPEKLGDFLPKWFDKNISKSGDVLALANEALKAQLPGKLYRTIALGSLQRGHLTVYCSSSTAKMEIDAVLRQTLLRNIQIATKGLIFKVKIVVNREYSMG